jgi:hypothetical protein
MSDERDSHVTPARTHQAKAGRRKCRVCCHPERIRIEALHVGAVSLDALEAEFGIQRDAIHRHCKNHVSRLAKVNYLAGPVQIATLAQAAAREGKSVLEYLPIIRSILMNQLVKQAVGAPELSGACPNHLCKVAIGEGRWETNVDRRIKVVVPDFVVPRVNR